MKLKQIIQYGILTVSTVAIMACATESNLKQSREYLKEADVVCAQTGCLTEILPIKKSKPLTIESITECLASNGAVLYGASWCSHCQDQKSLFGDQIKNIKYVECGEDDTKCEKAGVDGYPTWVINNSHYPGMKSLEELSKIADCNLKTE